MGDLRARINEYFAGVEPFKLISRSILVAALAYALTRVLFNFRGTNASAAVRALPGADQMIAKEKEKMIRTLEKTLHGHLDMDKMLTIPAEGITGDRIIGMMQKMKEREDPKWKTGRVSGGIYIGDDKHLDLVNQAYSLFTVSNPIHPDVWPSVRKFESEVIRMTAETCGAMTSGGTESIIMALKTYRDHARNQRPDVTEPEFIVPVTAHAAFDKGAQYLGMKIIHAPLAADMRVDVGAMRKLITRNTVLLVASAPNFPHGMIDPVTEIGALAMEFNLGLHVDCCLGGFVLPWLRLMNPATVPEFDFRVRAVTSISCDTHKYGQAPKGSSVILYRTTQLRRFMYFSVTEWPGGLYMSPTMSGSRSGAVIAATWASLLRMGASGFKQQAVTIAEGIQKLRDAISGMPELYIIGNPVAPVLAWGSKDIDVFRVGDVMSKKGWALNTLHKPNAMHICVTARHALVIDELIADLKDAVQIVKTTPASKEGFAPVYGLAASLPDRGVISDFLFDALDVMLQS